MGIRLAARMQKLAPYLFAELDRKKREAQARAARPTPAPRPFAPPPPAG
jgi:hypothetical protein